MPMRAMPSDMAVPGAGLYGEGDDASRASARPPRKSPPTANSSSGDRKRPRTLPAQHEDEPEEEKKRARGRPRLDTTDQTPQERRRTQIRLAQRAYRNRKESAITTLEKEVDGLKETNQQMGDAYKDLMDYVSRQGLLNHAPDLAIRLANLEKLSKVADEQFAKNDEDDSSDGNGVRLKDESTEESGSMPRIALQPPLSERQPARPSYNSVMGTHEQIPQHTSQADLSNARFPQPPSQMGYEVIVRPTSENATFAPNLSYDQPNLFTAWTTTPTPWHPVANPDSYSFQELTFGRRLQRETLQRAAKLLTMKDPPPDRLLRVFGFARLFETFEQIKERTLACIGSTTDDNLTNGRYPFQTLGGSGTHFPVIDAPDFKGIRGRSSASHNSSASPGSTPGSDTSPFSMGPFDIRTSKIRESLIGLGSQINLPGFDGIFWDADEVEYYLLHNGIDIPPLVDHFVVELEDGIFAAPPNDTLNLSQQPVPTDPQRESSTASAHPISGMGPTEQPIMMEPPTAYPTHVPSGENITMPPNSTGREPWHPQTTSAADMNYTGNNYTHTHTNEAAGPGPFDNNGSAPFTDPSLLTYPPNPAPYHGMSQPQIRPPPKKKAWRMDVNKFMDALISKGVCLGRTPGFRPKDVDMAFWASVERLYIH